MPEQPGPDPALYQPRAIPTMYNVVPVPGGVDGMPYVALIVQNAAGTNVSFIDADTALQVAENMRREARAVKQGKLIVPPGASGLINPNGQAL